MIDLTSVIRPGDGIIWGQACAEPQTLVEALVAQRERLGGVGLFLGSSYSGTVAPEHADHLRLSSYCATGANRALAAAGVLDILPAPYSQLDFLIRNRFIKCDVLMLQVSPPNAAGEYGFGLAVEYLAAAFAVARAVVAEVNDQVPWVRTEPLLRRDDFDLVIESSRPPVVLPPGKSGPLEKAIAQHAAGLVPDGATIETGIGALPNAVLSALRGRNGLRMHTGAVLDGAADLQLDSCVGGVLMGSQRLLDWAIDRAALRLVSSVDTHGAAALSRLERFVAINAAVEVDLTGQVNGEAAGGAYVGAVGGALDFVRAANQSPGGVSITVVPASRIVATLSGPVSVPRGEAGVIVSERGAADLRGCTLREREKRLRAISGSS